LTPPSARLPFEGLSESRITVVLDCEHERQSEAGVSRTARALARSLERRADVALIRLGGGPAVRRDTVKKRLVTIRQDLWWYPFRGRRLAGRLEADIYHCPTPRAPATRGRIPLVVTIHDLASFRFPETLTTWTRHYERTMLPRVASAADRILTPSADTADDVQTILRVAAEKIRVVPNGVDADFFRRTESGRPFSFPYVLFVGTPQPRKNLARLSAAVQRLHALGHDLRLVVAGADGWGDVQLTGSRVEAVGRVSDERLRILYQHAECLALVSLHEGFGLPALEAMAMGTPVVASNTAALPEVVGTAGVLVDPLNIDAIAAGILEAIARRDELGEAGRNRASAYSWELAAERTTAVYRELGGR
jgi:glycosyltransferase involved in cell wall biosynthesis